jgi:hypothetical protein
MHTICAGASTLAISARVPVGAVTGSTREVSDARE